jgi:hypothetical protein
MAAAVNATNAQKLYAAFGLLMFSFLFFLIAMGAPNWTSASTTVSIGAGRTLTFTSNAGLWRGCVTSTATTCTSVSCSSSGGGTAGANCSKLDTTRTFTIFSFFGMFVSCLMVAFYVFHTKIPIKLPDNINKHMMNKKVVCGVIAGTNVLVTLAWIIFASIDTGGASVSLDFSWVFMLLVSIFNAGVIVLLWITPNEAAPATATGTATPQTTKPAAATTPKA